MSSTNKTSHYNLSQYLGTDKPTYLADYNTDMSNIDTGIYTAKSEADTNATNIGTLTNLTTTAKTSLVSAINEVDGNADTANSNIGTLSSLTTTVKTDLVSAINEVDAEADSNTSNIGTLSNLTTTNKTNLVSAVNEVKKNFEDKLLKMNIRDYQQGHVTITNGTISTNRIQLAYSDDLSLFKIYGFVEITKTAGDIPKISFALPTGMNSLASDSYVIRGGCCLCEASNSNVKSFVNITFDKTNNAITVEPTTTLTNFYLFFIPCLYFNQVFEAEA